MAAIDNHAPTESSALGALQAGVAERDAAAPLDSRASLGEFVAYVEVLQDYLEQGGEPARQKLVRLSRELAAQQTPLPDAIAALWNAAAPILQASIPARVSVTLERARDAEHGLVDAYDQVFAMGRRSHLRLASAYAQKVREISTLLDYLPAFIFLKDLQFRYTSVNGLYCEALGISATQVIALTDFQLFSDETANTLALQERKVLESQMPVNEEVSLVLGGQTRTVMFIKAPILNGEGRPEGLIGVGFDLTERKRTESERARLAAAVEAIADGVYVTDVTGAIQYVNPAFEKTTGYSREEVVGSNPRILKSGKHAKDFYRQMWHALTCGELWKGNLINRKKDGSFFEADMSIAPVRDNGVVTSYVAVARDITERRRMVDTLQRAVMVKSEFTSMVSHELRTPLTAIKEAIDVVEDETAGPINAHQKDFLTLAKRNVDRLHRLINDTLDFSKLERGEFHLQPDRHDLNAAVAEVVAQQSLPATKRGLRMEFLPDHELAPVLFDPDRISQVLVNLIGNAIRYSEQGSINVRTLGKDGEVWVEVEDSGPGIPEDELQHIFDAFVQLSSGAHRMTGGTGLGLAISKKIVELHGGRIWAESDLGQGSKFIFTLATNHREPAKEL